MKHREDGDATGSCVFVSPTIGALNGRDDAAKTEGNQAKPNTLLRLRGFGASPGRTHLILSN